MDGSPLPLWLALVLTGVSGVLYGISFPPLAWRPIAWMALVPWLVAIRRGSAARASLLGILWAHIETYITSDCLPGAIVDYWRQSVLVGWLVLEGATVLTMVPWYAAFAVAYWVLARRYGAALPILTAAAWVGAELARVKVLGGNPWALFGYSQVGMLPLMQIAEVAGVHGIAFVLAAVNAAVAELCLMLWSPVTRRTSAHLGFGLASAAALVAIALLYGVLRMRSVAVSLTGEETTIAIIQGNVDIESQWRSDLYGKNLDVYLELTAAAARNAAVRLILWPESAMTFFLAEEPLYRRSLARVLEPFDLQLLAGGPRVGRSEAGDAESYFNGTFLVAPDGEVLGWQDKRKLLPFAEYFPFQTIGVLKREFGRPRQFLPGEVRPPLPSVAGRAGIVVCNEAMYPEPSSDAVALGAELLVNPANDSWFGSAKYSLQAFDIARLRAVEQRRYLVRTSTSGPSAIVDPVGRVVVESALFSRQWIAGAVRPMSARTIYQRVGDLFATICAALALGGIVRAAHQSGLFSGQRRRTSKHRAGDPPAPV